jgi:hypothetical protein
MNNIDFDKIKEIAATFPKLPKREKSMIEIGGCRNDENVNSHYLAFFFKENEEHGLGRLFFDSLLEVLELVARDFQGKYTVNREVPTKKNNRIDIVIKSESNDWAVIIENKIYHYLGNDLQDYWDSVTIINEEKKECLILSLHEEHKNYHENYKNITHQAIINKVKENLGQKITNCNPKYLPFLRDFILNVENYYYYEREDVKQAYQDRLFYYFENNKNCKEDILKDILKDIDDMFRRKLGTINFQPASTQKTDWWLYYDKKERFQIYYDRNTNLEKREIYIRLSVKDEDFDKLKDIQIRDPKNKLTIEQSQKKNKDNKITRIATISHKLEKGYNYVVLVQDIIDVLKKYFQEINQK